LGSGFAIDDAGTILTNQHVVRGADQIEVIDVDGQRYEAKLVGSDALTDLAVVQIPAGLVPAAPLGTSSDLVVGEPAVALGNPSGFSLQNSEATVTSGVISGVGRDIQSQGGR
jgi:serine protease Do